MQKQPQTGIRLLRESRPRARKTHECLICGSSIRKFTRHCYWVAIDYDAMPMPKLRAFRFHVSCPPPGVNTNHV